MDTTDLSRELRALESAVMSMLLAGEHPALRTLRVQYAKARIKKIQETGAGFFIEFQFDGDVPRLAERFFSFGDVEAEIEGLAHGAGFVLHVRDGVLNTLEGYSYDEPWPLQLGTYKLNYSGGGRNLEALHTRLQ